MGSSKNRMFHCNEENEINTNKLAEKCNKNEAGKSY